MILDWTKMHRGTPEVFPSESKTDGKFDLYCFEDVVSIDIQLHESETPITTSLSPNQASSKRFLTCS